MIHCPHCQYALEGLTRNVCPECGNQFNPARLRAIAAKTVLTRKRVTIALVVPIAMALVPQILVPATRWIDGGSDLFFAFAMVGMMLSLVGTPIWGLIAGSMLCSNLAEVLPVRDGQRLGTLRGLGVVLGVAVGITVLGWGALFGGCVVAFNAYRF